MRAYTWVHLGGIIIYSVVLIFVYMHFIGAVICLKIQLVAHALRHWPVSGPRRPNRMDNIPL